MSGTDGTVESDGGGDDDVTDGTEHQLGVLVHRYTKRNIAYMAPAASLQLRPREIWESASAQNK